MIEIAYLFNNRRKAHNLLKSFLPFPGICPGLIQFEGSSVNLHACHCQSKTHIPEGASSMRRKTTLLTISPQSVVKEAVIKEGNSTAENKI